MKALSCLIAVSFSFATIQISGQDEKTKKFEISIVTGLSIPIGSYGKKDPGYSAIYIDKEVLQSIRGFDKGKSGFAKTGFDYNLEINYKLTSALKLVLRTGTFSNSVETTGMSEFLTHIYDDREIKVEENDYRYIYITPGISYCYSVDNFDFGADISMGYSMTNYPYYKFVLLFTLTDPPIIVAHDGPQPDLSAFMIGSSLTANYNVFKQFKIGFVLSYRSTNFSYDLSPRSIPGGSTSFDFSDILKVRVLNTEFKISYNF